jgi:hypothetical protein
MPVNLMLDHEVGISSQLYNLPMLGRDYFDESVGCLYYPSASNTFATGCRSCIP